ncbi:MAG TPA: glycosyltransferase family 9 protein [Puia sp.]|jgi:ADP-heptose:LPS heptosyltransferase|nr:glycosyltransferase family 9 protein [Puia sp.]
MQIRRKQKIDWYAGYLLIGILLPLTRLLGVVMRRDHSIGQEPKRIIFIKLLGLGSLIVAADAIQAIRVRFPGARLILLTDKNIADGIAPFHLFDEIYPIDTENLGKTSRGVIRFLFRAWSWRGLWVIDLEVYSKLTTVLALLTLARNRVGFYLSYVPFRRFLNTHNVTWDQAVFLEDNYRYMARQLTGSALPTFVPAVRQAELEKQYIILNNTCSGLADVRKLPDGIFSAVVQWILEHTDYEVALLGMPSDRDAINLLISSKPDLQGRRERILNYAGMAEDFAAYYSFLRDKGVCLVTIDSGPLHIARKLGLPTVSVWGPTNPESYLRVEPHEKERHLYYYLRSPCSPCVHHYETLPCGGNNFCMKNIPAAAIIAKIQELLGHLAAAHPG